MNYQLNFKDNYLSSVWKTTKAVWLKVSLAYFTVLIITGIMIAVVIWSLGNSFIAPLLPNDASILNISESSNVGLFPSMLRSVVLMFVFVLVSMFLSAWHYNFTFIAVNSKIKNEDLGFGNIFKKSFNSGILKIILISVFFIIFAFLFLVIITLSLRVDKWLIVTIIISTSLTAAFFLYKSILILPAFIIGKKSLDESFHYSFKHITSIRVIKLFGGSIVLFIILIIIEAGILSTSFLLSFVPLIGIISKIISTLFQMIILFLFSGFVIAFIISAIIGLYYRYEDGAKDFAINEVYESEDFDKTVEKLEDNDNEEQDEEDEPPSRLINNLFA